MLENKILKSNKSKETIWAEYSSDSDPEKSDNEIYSPPYKKHEKKQVKPNRILDEIDYQ
jgi:hypothetical protein